MPKLAILYCKRIKDQSCIACAKCYKAMAERNGQFAPYEDIELVAMTDCGDCPGLVVPKIKLLNEILTGLNRPFDILHLGTCMQVAMETGNCPIDFDDLQFILKKKINIQVVLGTHDY